MRVAVPTSPVMAPGALRRRARWARARAVAASWVSVAAVTACCVLFLSPLVWMVGASLQSVQELQRLPASWWPETGVGLANYGAALERMDFGRALRNSTLVGVLVVAGQLVSATAVGFVLARHRVRTRRLVLGTFLVSFVVPYQLTWIPSFVLLAHLGLIDTPAALILPFVAGPLGTLIMYTHFRATPRELEDAAVLDGCTPLQALVLVLAPAAAPALRVVATMTFLFAWSDLIWPMLMTHSAEVRTLPVALSTLKDEVTTDWPVVMAASTMTAVPVAGFVLLVLGMRVPRRRRSTSGGAQAPTTAVPAADAPAADPARGGRS